MRTTGLMVLLVLMISGCTSAEHQATKPGPSAQLSGVGCAGTALTQAEPPVWAQVGWTHSQGTLWPVPWAIGTPGDAVAFLFAVQLVAGASPRSDGSNNKVLWVIKDAAPFVVEGRPNGQSQPVLTVAGGPSIVDVPSPGCWAFRMIWQVGGAQHMSTVNLNVLPTGTLPKRLPAT